MKKRLKLGNTLSINNICQFIVRELSPGNYALWDRKDHKVLHKTTNLMEACELCVMYRAMHNHANRMTAEEMYRMTQER